MKKTDTIAVICKIIQYPRGGNKTMEAPILDLEKGWKMYYCSIVIPKAQNTKILLQHGG